MQSYYEREASLHQVLVHSSVSPEYIQVKPKGFKTILQSTVEFLEAQQIQANLFFIVKPSLPSAGCLTLLACLLVPLLNSQRAIAVPHLK
jgi:hypothetical protein